MHIHPRHLLVPVALHHAEKLPAVPLIKRGMAGNQIKRRDSERLHVRADKREKRACDAMSAELFLHIQRAEVGLQILPVMKIILNNSGAADDRTVLHHKIPLGNSSLI